MSTKVDIAEIPAAGERIDEKPEIRRAHPSERAIADWEARRAAWKTAPNVGRQLDDAHTDWVKAGKPENENDAVYQHFVGTLKDYIESQTRSLFRVIGEPTWKRKNPLVGHIAKRGKYLDEEYFNEVKLKRALQAADTYDPAHPSGAKFTTYLRNPLAQAEVDALRRSANPTTQQIIGVLGCESWVDYAADTRESGIADRYFKVAKWIANQDLHKRQTWRDVAAAFPAEFGSEDKAQRALQAIRDAAEELKQGKKKNWARIRRCQERVKAAKRAEQDE
jgi:hypothetical protein